MKLFRFDRDSYKWPDFIQNFKNRGYDKRSFTDDIRMERLLSVMVVSFLKLKSVLDHTQITNENRAGLRAFHQQLKSVITWLNSMGDTSAINSIENTTKAITRLPRYIRSKFYRDFKDAKLNNQSLNLTKFEIWPGNKVTERFNPISAIIKHQKKQKQDFHKDSHHLEKDNRNPYPTFLALGDGTSNYQPNILLCWLCFKGHKIAECNQFVTISVDERLRLVNNCKSKVFCKVDYCKKSHHALLHTVNKGNNGILLLLMQLRIIKLTSTQLLD